MRAMPAPARPAVALLLLLAAACSESDVVTVRVTLAPDGSGTVSASSLSIPTEKLAFEGRTKGAEWTDRATLACAKGTFKSLAALEMADIRFSSGTTAEGSAYVRATFPAGSKAAWCGVFAPPPDVQKKAAGTLDPTGRATSSGSMLKLEVEVPGQVVAVGHTPLEIRGITTDKTKDRAMIVVPIHRTLESGEKEIVFDMTWRNR